MFYRACLGCVRQGQPCDARDQLKARLKGLGITSVKWKCAEREARFAVGGRVWAKTFCGFIDEFSDGSPIEEFPGTVVRLMGSKALVYIRPGIIARDEETEFTPARGGHGFCKIPLSRLKARQGERANVCPECELPEEFGHQEGFACDARQRFEADRAKGGAE